MMKRVCTLLVALLLLAAALAEEAPVNEAPVNEMPGIEAPAAEDAVIEVAFSEVEAGYPGVWVPFRDGFRMYLPVGWRSCALAPEEAAAGLFYRAGNGDGEADGGVPMGVAVGWMDADGLDALEDYFTGAGFSGVERLSLNGIPAVSFRQDGAGFCGVAFMHPALEGYALLAYATPIGETADGILSSVSPREAE